MDTHHTRDHLVVMKPGMQKVVFILCILLSLMPFAGPAFALFLGIAVAQISGHPYSHLNQKATHFLLQLSVVGLGFGMNIHHAIKAGGEGLLFTIGSITVTLIIGYLAGKFFKVGKKTSYLISNGTAICGGSAIAAISPVIKAREKDISVALGCVFTLNSIALLVFPAIGHYFHLSQTQFGLWCAIAIHDTSSVVGAASKYGAQALEIATSVKLARALWIIPVALLSNYFFKTSSQKVKIPYFILLFVLAMAANTYIRSLDIIYPYLVQIAKMGLTLTLFLIGSGLSRRTFLSVGVRPFLQGTFLWLAMASLEFYIILNFI
ncbi:YeiH family protein [Pararcticibacter amylolyticus]|uniref:Putative sulfate exporter family transporter n=1 Tax=Pararcticibacter amylolyticus TaxID=2173175 RepID=A0A2U2PCU6_9SPHI|nr:putative sulfate exporter family transporter [Pararcticibacter amylolyticus]PWG79216.1 putative sulfate exporter family transporter [Pararcticibacter amylolyticus]